MYRRGSPIDAPVSHRQPLLARCGESLLYTWMDHFHSQVIHADEYLSPLVPLVQGVLPVRLLLHRRDDEDYFHLRGSL